MPHILHSVVRGFGYAVPEKIVTNDDLSKTLETSDEWISERTGIRERRIAESNDSVASLGVQAARNALRQAQVSAEDVDAILLATTSPDHLMPATATRIQTLLGIQSAFAFDIQAVCSGFLYALSTADAFIRSGSAKTILVIGADVMSRMVDWTDRSTCVLFGDGAGAVVVQASSDETTGILSTHLFSDGKGYDKLYSDPAVVTPAGRGGIVMNGRAVYVTAIESMEKAVRFALEYNGVQVSDLDAFVAHQANRRILDAVAVRLGLPPEKVIVTIDRFANTSAATIPLTLAVGLEEGRLRKGQLVAMAAMGAGFTWASALVRI